MNAKITKNARLDVKFRNWSKVTKIASHNVFDCITSIGKLMKTCFNGLFFGFFHPSIYVFYRKTTIGKHLILFWSLIYVWTYNLYAFTLVNSQRHVLMDFFGFFYQSIYVFNHIITIGKHIILFRSLIYLFLSFSYPIN